MPDLWLSSRGPQLATLDYRYEKAGLTIERQPIPWNAEAVVVEAHLRETGERRHPQRDFLLRIAGSRQTFSPLNASSTGTATNSRLTFRLPPPTQRTTVELLWKQRSLGQMALPVLTRTAFTRSLALELATPAVRLGDSIVPCQTYVSSQCQELIASAVLTCGSCLAPIVDLDARVEFRPERSGAGQDVPLRLTATQLSAQRALVTVGLRKPRRIGPWQVTWKLDGRTLGSQRLRAISKPQFQQSLRVVDTRLVVQGEGPVQLLSHRPSSAGARLGPCFVIRSTQPGMAALCDLQVRTQVEADAPPALTWEEQRLITDGPTPITPGTLAAGEWEQALGFELRAGKRILGVLPLTASPAASFNTEGGFEAAEPFLWNDFADQELQERLNRLLS